MYVQRKNEARSCNHCCRVITINVTYSECVLVAFGIQYAMRVRHVTFGLHGFTYFFSHYLINGTIFDKKLLNTKCVF